MPNVSVIIISKNRQTLLQEAIGSVLLQTYQDIELIVVDDDSADNTAQIVQDIKSSVKIPIKYVRISNRNARHGLGYLRNAAIKLADGEYIACLDDDDIWYPQKLQKQLEFFSERPERQLIFSNALVKDSVLGKVSKYVTEEWAERLKKSFYYSLMEKNFIPFSSVMFRHEGLKDTGFFNESVVYLDDYEFVLRMASMFRIDFLDEVLMDYRIQNDNFSHKKIVRYSASKLFWDNYILPEKFQSALGRKIVRSQRAKENYCLAYAYLQNGDSRMGKEYLLNSIRHWPLYSWQQYYYFLIALLPEKIVGCLRQYE